MDVIPKNNLPEPSQPWGRDIERRVTDLTTDADRTKLENLNNNKQLNASINQLNGTIGLIQGNVDDLSGRSSYSVGDAASVSWNTTQAANLAYGNSLTLDFDKPRVALITFILSSELSIYTGSGSSGNSTLRVSATLDGTDINSLIPGPFIGVNAATITGSNIGTTNTSNTVATGLLNVSAGTHTFRGLIRERTITASGTGFGGIFVSGSQLMVQIFQLG